MRVGVRNREAALCFGHPAMATRCSPYPLLLVSSDVFSFPDALQGARGRESRSYSSESSESSESYGASKTS